MENLTDQIIAGCRIEKWIGQGGMGSVYKAWHINLDIPVAIKFLDSRFSKNPNLVEQFFLEAKATARLDSPHILRIMQVGEENGFYFIQMEFVEGESLQKKIERESPFPPSVALNCLFQIASGLQAAHQGNVIHGDIKPDNILINKKGILKIVDFGLAKVLGKSTQDSKIFGSLHYLSPEQCEGSLGDAKSDIYSLGITFYFMITGQLPFQENSPLAIAVSRLYSQPISPLRVVPGIPKELENITQKMMSRSVANRYQSTEELLSDIEPLLIQYPFIPEKLEPEISFIQNSSPFSLLTPKAFLPEEGKQQELPSMEILENKLKNSLPQYSLVKGKKKLFPYFFLLIIAIFISCFMFYFFLQTKYSKHYHGKNMVFFDQRGPLAKEISGVWKIQGKNLQGTSKGLREAQITWEIPNKPFRLSIEFLLQQIHTMPRPGSKLEIIIQLEEKQYRIPFFPKSVIQHFVIEGNGREIFFFGMEPPLPDKIKFSRGRYWITLLLKTAKIEIQRMEWSKK